MFRLITRRLAISAVLLFVISLLTFILQSLAPGDVAETILGSGSGSVGRSYSEEQYQQLRQELGLDQPLLVQYWNWLTSAVLGDLGTSPVSGLDVTAAISSRLPVTLSLVALGTLATAIVGVGLGVVSAVRGGRLGRVVDVLSLLGSALPNFWLALLFMALFAVTLGLLPATGFVSFTDSPQGWAESLVLPVTTLVVAGAATFAKQTRDSMLTALTHDSVRMLRANGASEASIVWRHALRNAAIPVVTLVGLVFIGLFSGAVFIENVFALPGIGRLAVQAANQHDLPVVQGVVVALTLVVIVTNLLVDLTYGWLNPKVRTP
ncbi:ABC transporter permease [Jiangella muralis]|uniref:ABC transporter permease n=1 Tax=Jiangella muralis TaxID=702383 RepID=UPI00069E6BF1|nr:ABC transporter permease [Jiangella muralis]